MLRLLTKMADALIRICANHFPNSVKCAIMRMLQLMLATPTKDALRNMHPDVPDKYTAQLRQLSQALRQHRQRAPRHHEQHALETEARHGGPLQTNGGVKCGLGGHQVLTHVTEGGNFIHDEAPDEPPRAWLEST